MTHRVLNKHKPNKAQIFVIAYIHLVGTTTRKLGAYHRELCVRRKKPQTSPGLRGEERLNLVNTKANISD